MKPSGIKDALTKARKRIEIHEAKKIEAINKKTKEIKVCLEANNEILALFHVYSY